jgi:putative FmdB family regulatory protein
MPIYEYACDKCDKVFEQLIVRKCDEAEIECPSCQSQDVHRVLSRTAAGTKSGSGAPGRGCGPVG